MSENENDKKTNSTEEIKEEIKKETKETVNQVKETIKKVDFKEDTKATTSFVKEMFSNPFEAIRNVASGKENVFSKAVILTIIYVALSVICQILSLFKYGKYSGLGHNFKNLIISILNPAIYLVVVSAVVYLFNRENKKSLTTVLSTIVVCSVPIIINEAISIIAVLVSGISIITSPISTMFSAIATVLTYFGMKDLLEVDEHKDFIKKYAVIRLVIAFAFVILARIGIY